MDRSVSIAAGGFNRLSINTLSGIGILNSFDNSVIPLSGFFCWIFSSSMLFGDGKQGLVNVRKPTGRFSDGRDGRDGWANRNGSDGSNGGDGSDDSSDGVGRDGINAAEVSAILGIAAGIASVVALFGSAMSSGVEMVLTVTVTDAGDRI